MRSIIIRRIIGFSAVLFLMAFSTLAHSQTQEQLGQAIQQAAVLNQQHNSEIGAAQEQLGQVILETAQHSILSNSTDGRFQEQLGHEIQDAATFQYAHGLIQERMGNTIVQMEIARS
ncbi:MAG: hypothetical protein HY282_14245 [Nitrospirae bacterium]|nr:hypothetical protein [Candidatus Manganitrophaceae bacterium]